MAPRSRPVTAEEITAYMEKAYEIAQEGRALHERIVATIDRPPAITLNHVRELRTIRRGIEDFSDSVQLVHIHECEREKLRKQFAGRAATPEALADAQNQAD